MDCMSQKPDHILTIQATINRIRRHRDRLRKTPEMTAEQEAQAIADFIAKKGVKVLPPAFGAATQAGVYS